MDGYNVYSDKKNLCIQRIMLNLESALTSVICDPQSDCSNLEVGIGALCVLILVGVVQKKTLDHLGCTIHLVLGSLGIALEACSGS